MPTFDDLRTNLRKQILVEDPENFYTPERLLEYVREASIEIASKGRFPIATSSITATLSATSVTAPTNMLDTEVKKVAFDGIRLSPVDEVDIQLYRQTGHSAVPRYYRYDPKENSPGTGSVVKLAPKVDATGTVTIEYVRSLEADRTASADASVWTGVFPQFHDLITLRAAFKAFEQGFEYGQTEQPKAEYWRQRYNERLQQFAAFLGNTSLLDLVIQPVGEQQ